MDCYVVANRGVDGEKILLASTLVVIEEDQIVFEKTIVKPEEIGQSVLTGALRAAVMAYQYALKSGKKTINLMFITDMVGTLCTAIGDRKEVAAHLDYTRAYKRYFQQEIKKVLHVDFHYLNKNDGNKYINYAKRKGRREINQYINNPE